MVVILCTTLRYVLQDTIHCFPAFNLNICSSRYPLHYTPLCAAGYNPLLACFYLILRVITDSMPSTMVIIQNLTVIFASGIT